jgi:apolipoprotein N-acyltransferase
VDSKNFRLESVLAVNKKVKREQAPKGSVHGFKLAFLLVFAILLSPFAVAFWIMGIMTPQNARDWVVLIFYVVLLVATICILLLYLFAFFKRKKCSKTSA